MFLLFKVQSSKWKLNFYFQNILVNDYLCLCFNDKLNTYLLKKVNKTHDYKLNHTQNYNLELLYSNPRSTCIIPSTKYSNHLSTDSVVVRFARLAQFSIPISNSIIDTTQTAYIRTQN